jgi:polyisoprenoid-binding protein YceI
MTRRFAFIGSAGTLVVVAALAVGVWYLLFRDNAPPTVNLGDAVAAASSAAATSTHSRAAPASTSTTAPASDGLAGAWQLVGGGQSFVGYRVQEQLANFGAATAVGRTTEVMGSLDYEGSAITDVSIEADVSALESDRSQRDNALRRQALETDRYPTATFKLSQPIHLDHTPAAGETISATATGDLTIHGVTRSVSIPIQGQLVNGQVVVVGSAGIVFADYRIAQPTAASVLSVEDRGVLELQLVFTHA